MFNNPNVSDKDIYYTGEDGVWAESHLDGYTDFYKDNLNDKVWTIDPYPSEGGPFYFSFDRKTIYNFWTDFNQLSEAQKAIFRDWNPMMAALKERDVSQIGLKENDDDEK
ncbi:MAG: hypothetical protein Q4A67_02185 [Aerococcus sp.]|nr:hypothetical protein [Aerococcus sp.]